MGMFDDLIPTARKAIPAAPAAKPQGGMFDDLIPAARAAPAIAPSGIMQDGIRRTLGDTAAKVAGYLPPVAGLGMWLDAAAAEKDNPSNPATDMLQTFENTMRGVGQGTNPTVSEGDGRVRLGEIVSEDDGGTRYYRDAEGKDQPAVGDVVVLRGPDGKLSAYSRSAQTDEGGLVGASRVATQGMLTGPVTGVARNAALVSPASGAVAGGRAAQATEDLAAFERSNVPVFAPSFSGAPTRMMAKGLSDTWGVGAPLQDALTNTYRGMADEAARIADGISPVNTFDQAGADVQRGLQRFRADGVRDIEPGVLTERAIPPNAPVQPHQVMSQQAQQRAVAAVPARQANQGGQAQTQRGVNVPAARSLDQTYTARRGAEDLSDAEVQRLIVAPANDTSFAVRSEALYENAQRQLPPQMRINNTRNPQQFAAMNSRGAVNALRAEQEGSQIPGGIFGRYQGMADRLQTNLQIEDLRAMRTAVGRDIALLDYGRTGLDTQQLKSLYGAVSRDMEIYYQDVANRAHLASRLSPNRPDYISPEVARRADRALYEFRRADRYFRQGMQRIETFMSVMGANRPELAAQKLVQAAAEGGTGNMRMLNNALGALRPEERQSVASLVVRQLGAPVASARGLPQEMGFSPQSFVTRWQKLDPRARELLFGGEHSQALDDLFAVSNRLANVEAFANTSNSARMAMNAGIPAVTATAVAGLPMALAGAFGSYGTSVILSRPAYARWATQYLRLKSQAARSPAGINAALTTQVNRLAEMAKSDPTLDPMLAHLRNSTSGEVGVGEGGEKQDRQEQRDVAPEQSKGDQGSNDGGATHGGSVSSSGLMINAVANARDFIDNMGAIVREDVVPGTRGGLFPAAKYTDGKYHLAWPQFFDDAQDIQAEGAETRAGGMQRPEDQDWEAAKETAGQSFNAAGAVGTGGFGMTVAGKGVPEGAVGAFGGKLFGRGQTPEAQLATVQKEIADLGQRHRSLFGREFAAPRPRPGSSPDEILQGELRVLDRLRAVVAEKEASLAGTQGARPPRVADRSGERETMLQGLEQNPTTRAIPGRQGAPSIKEQKKLIEGYYSRPGDPLPEGPWGRDPLQYQEVVRQQAQHEATNAKAKFQEKRQEITRLKEEKAVAEGKGQTALVQRLQAELRAANDEAVKAQKETIEWQNRLNEALRLLGKKDGLDD
jgi:hypothetical protein